jgi:hypothetical protein
MLRCVALVRTDISEERIASIIRVRIGELGTMLAVTSNRRTLFAPAPNGNEYQKQKLTFLGSKASAGT